ncbi:MAG: T9SS type A sorting domain-containing protein [Sphingobacteriales bacterium]|nr:MAG: T9SS type A sorting domain-containing protein [Sphingobacteriales bacterium]
MKQTLLIAAAVAATMGAQAQKGLLETPKTETPTVTPEGKTDATLYRLVGLPTYKYDGAQFKPSDSMGLSYSGIRGGLIIVNLEALIYPSSELPLKPDVQGGYTYNTGTASWDKSSQTISTYDTKQNLETATSQNWNGTAWVNTNKSLYAYDANNNNTQVITQNWNGTTFENNRRTTKTYDANNRLTENTEQTWDGSAWANTNGNKTIFTYTASGRPETKITQSWSSGAWKNDNKYFYNYTGNNIYPDDQVAQNWNGTTWDNVSKQIYTYASPGVLQTSVSQDWISGAWQNSGKSDLTTDANTGSITTVISATWDGSAWKNSSKINYGFNSNNLVSSYDGQSWNAGGFWEYAVGAIKQTVYYEQYTNNVAGVDAQQGTLKLYPNPVLNMLNIDMAWDNAEPFTVTVYDMQGRVVRHFTEVATKNYSKTIGTDDMSIGSYMLVIKGAKGQTSAMFNVIK